MKQRKKKRPNSLEHLLARLKAAGGCIKYTARHLATMNLSLADVDNLVRAGLVTLETKDDETFVKLTAATSGRVFDKIATALRSKGYRELTHAGRIGELHFSYFMNDDPDSPYFDDLLVLVTATGGNVRVFRSGAFGSVESVLDAVEYVTTLPSERLDYEIAPDYQDDDEKALARAVRRFAMKMLDKLIVKKRRDGYHGWQEVENRDDVRASFTSHAWRLSDGDDSQAVDTASLAMMLDRFESEVQP
jgi:hypothetical protein